MAEAEGAAGSAELSAEGEEDADGPDCVDGPALSALGAATAFDRMPALEPLDGAPAMLLDWLCSESGTAKIRNASVALFMISPETAHRLICFRSNEEDSTGAAARFLGACMLSEDAERAKVGQPRALVRQAAQAH